MCRKLIEFFQLPRYRLNKTLLCLNGQWPYQEKTRRHFLLITTLSFSLIILPAQIRKVIVYRNDWSIIIPTMGPIIVHSACVIKILNSVYYADKMRLLLEQIYDDWHAPMGEEDKILKKCSDDGHLFTVIYTVWLYVSTISFLILSNLPHILAVNGWTNMSSPDAFVFPVYFTAHDEEYYNYIQGFLCAGILSVLSISIAVDGFFVILVQHACGLFAAVSYRLEHLVDGANLDVDLHPPHMADEPFWVLVDCIKKHKAAIQFADLLDSTFSWSFLLMLGCNTLSMSFTGLQVLIGANPDSLHEAIRQAVFAGSQLLHLLFENAFSQRLTDHSSDVFVAVTRSNWYNTSLKSRKLLIFMLMRSITPWELKAGKMVTMSMATFSSIVRTSLSYLTILSSME